MFNFKAPNPITPASERSPATTTIFNFGQPQSSRPMASKLKPTAAPFLNSSPPEGLSAPKMSTGGKPLFSFSQPATTAAVPTSTDTDTPPLPSLWKQPGSAPMFKVPSNLAGTQEPSLKNVLDTLTLVNANILNLSTSLHSAEQRIARLEIATSDFPNVTIWLRSAEDRIAQLEAEREKDRNRGIGGLATTLQTAEDRISRVETEKESKSNFANPTAFLRSAEGRIAALERAKETTKSESKSWTPLGSPVLPSSESNAGQKNLDTGIGTTETSSTSAAPPDQVPNSHVVKESKPHSSEQDCSIQTHLKPLVDGITSLASQIAQIDSRLSKISPILQDDNASRSTTPKPEADSVESSNLPTPKSSPSSAASPRPENSDENPVTQEDAVQPAPDPISKSRPSLRFGEPSTPNSRPLSHLNIAASPFGKYGEQSSPFAQLAESAKQTGTSQTCFSCKNSCPKCSPELTSDSSESPEAPETRDENQRCLICLPGQDCPKK